MPMIYVKPVPGVVARMSPRGPVLPADKYTPVQDSAYLQRLIHVHKDVVVRDEKSEKKSKETPAS